MVAMSNQSRILPSHKNQQQFKGHIWNATNANPFKSTGNLKKKTLRKISNSGKKSHWRSITISMAKKEHSGGSKEIYNMGGMIKKTQWKKTSLIWK